MQEEASAGCRECRLEVGKICARSLAAAHDSTRPFRGNFCKSSKKGVTQGFVL
jgi:hypothetical protein